MSAYPPSNIAPQPYPYEAPPLPAAQLQQQQQHPPSYGEAPTIEHDGDLQTANATGTPSSAGDGPKANRLRKACDSCSIRKVKCDEAGPPCRACSALDIPCTFERPSRRRGPPNRHAEEFKKRKLDSPTAPTFASGSPHTVAATLADFSSHGVLNAESICPFPILELLVDDFFTYIHPLAPFPHEPSFRAAFRHREDINNPPFLALLASMVGVLVASFPRKPRLHLKAHGREHLFPNSMSLVERCHKVAVEARGAGYLDKDLSVYDAATSYFLGLAVAYTFRWKKSRLYFGETLNIIRVIGAHKQNGPTFASEVHGAFSTGSEPEPVDYIRREIGRRLFWVMLAGVRSVQQFGASYSELIVPPPTPAEPYPPLPMEVDDEHIYVDHVDLQPAGTVSKLTGFNLNIQVYMTLTPLVMMEMAYGMEELVDWNRQKRVLAECLMAVKRALDDVPPEFRLSSSPSDQQHGLVNNLQVLSVEDSRRKLQFEIQKANIYASQLSTRSFVVERYSNLLDAHHRIRAASGEKPSLVSDFSEADLASERENIVKDLLRVLGSISQVNMEPNSASLINKIRQVAATLIDMPQDRKGPIAMKNEQYLARFLDVLMKLERVTPSLRTEDGGDLVEDEEEELRNWADLREYQMRFAQSGGFLSDL